MNEHIQYVGTPEFLESLDIDQLRKARQLADKRIKEIESENKIILSAPQMRLALLKVSLKRPRKSCAK